MPAGTYNFTIEQGADFERTFTWKPDGTSPKDLTDHTARMQIRTSVDSTTVVLELTTEAGNERLVLGGAAGTVKIDLTAAETAALTAPATFTYDLEIVGPTPDFFVTRLLQGTITTVPEVTR